MLLREKISRKLEQLNEYLSYLKSYQSCRLEDLKKDHMLRGAVERYLHLSVESVIDIAEIFISARGLQKAEEYREAIEILGDAGIIPTEFAHYFAPIAGFRNILVHEYAKVDLEEIHRHLMNDLSDFEKFAKYIIEFLNK